jgi:hypothetical protein
LIVTGSVLIVPPARLKLPDVPSPTMRLAMVVLPVAWSVPEPVTVRVSMVPLSV